MESPIKQVLDKGEYKGYKITLEETTLETWVAKIHIGDNKGYTAYGGSKNDAIRAAVLRIDMNFAI